MNIAQIGIVARVGTGKYYTSLGTAVALTPPAGANAVFLQAFAQDVRFTIDGTTATATNLLALQAGEQPFLLTFEPGTVFSFIEEAGGGRLAVQWARL